VGKAKQPREPDLKRRGMGRVVLKRFCIHVGAFTVPDTSRWLIAAWPEPSHPIVERPDGLVLAIWKPRYSEDKARALFCRVLEVVEREDLSGLRKTCRHWERDDELFCIAFGVTSDEDAMARRRRNEAELALYRRYRAGAISKDEWERTRKTLDVTMARHVPPPRA
jgi:hypothetical protein